MQDVPTHQLPRVALSHGDFNGIGYEVMLKTFADARMFEMLMPVLYGQSKAFAYYKKNFGLDSPNYVLTRDVRQASQGKFNIINIVENELKIEPGAATELSIEMSMVSMKRAVEDLRNGLVEGAAREALCARLRRNFKEHDGCLQTGFLGTSILMATLTDNGMADVAWDLLFQRKNPSWLYSIDNGATTIWERWNSYTLENGMGPAGMNSFNHYAYGSVCQWIWETVAGIAADTTEPGFKHIIMRPVPDKRLGFVKAEYKSAAGTIRSEWKFEGDKWIWNFTIPEGATASVTLPGETASTSYPAGTYSVEKKARKSRKRCPEKPSDIFF